MCFDLIQDLPADIGHWTVVYVQRQHSSGGIDWSAIAGEEPEVVIVDDGVVFTAATNEAHLWGAQGSHGYMYGE